jgi:hypothetical protein
MKYSLKVNNYKHGDSASVTLNYMANNPSWLELANDAFYLIGSAVFQCTEYH